jgi:hypothetical protein
MSANLEVHSEIPPISWEEFISTHPAGSIALDGYVGEGPNFTRNGPYANANHHEGVKRLETLSTAQQILFNVQMGLDKAFTKDGVFAPNVYVNDCDQDVCAAWYLLNNINQTRHSSPALNRFIGVAGTLDSTAGAFPFDPDLKILGELAWVFEPYTMFRLSGEMAKKDNSQYRSVIQDVENRIQKHLIGRGDSVKLDTRYEIIGGGKDWKMIKESGKDGRVGAFMDGIDAYVSVQELPNDRWRYTIGRRSEYIPFDVEAHIADLDKAEEPSNNDHWGGATIVGGSPRVGGSKLSPEEVEKIINERQD